MATHEPDISRPTLSCDHEGVYGSDTVLILSHLIAPL
jgi:hypothetical protein